MQYNGDPQRAFYRALKYLARARQFNIETIVDLCNVKVRSYLGRELPGDIEFLKCALEAAREKIELKAVEEKSGEGN